MNFSKSSKPFQHKKCYGLPLSVCSVSLQRTFVQEVLIYLVLIWTRLCSSHLFIYFIWARLFSSHCIYFATHPYPLLTPPAVLTCLLGILPESYWEMPSETLLKLVFLYKICVFPCYNYLLWDPLSLDSKYVYLVAGLEKRETVWLFIYYWSGKNMRLTLYFSPFGFFSHHLSHCPKTELVHLQPWNVRASIHAL